jgi:signal transduction histidine kinase
LIAEAYNALAIAQYAQSDYQNSLESNLAALEIRLQHGDDYSLLSSYSKVGNCHHELGNFDEALKYYLMSLEIAKKNDLVQQQGLLANNIAEIFMQQEEETKAREYYQIAIDIAQSTKDTLGWSKALTNLGIAEKNSGNFELAESLYQKALELIEGKNILGLKAGLYINFGALYKECNQPGKSISYYRMAEDIYRETGEMHGLTIVTANIGNSFLQSGKIDSAEIYFQNAVEYSKETNSLVRQESAISSLASYYRFIDNFQQAYHFDSIADALHDSIYTLEKAEIIAELNTRYETEKNEKLLAEQEAELTRRKLQVQQRNVQLAGSFAGLAVLVLFSWLFYRNQKNKQQKLEQQVALEKAETTNKIQQEKLRISRDLHDNIGSQLTFVISSLDNLNYIKNADKRNDRLRQLAQYTKETMAQLRETIWALNSDTITVGRLSSRVAEFINQVKNTFPEINFRVETTTSEKKLEASQAINIYRTMQEAVNNAVKHSECRNIGFKSDENSMSLTDDGRGFDHQTVEKGNGLLNMTERIKETGFNFEVHSETGQGTTIKVVYS